MDFKRLHIAPDLQDFLRSKRLERAGRVWRAEGKLIKRLRTDKTSKNRTTSGKITSTLDGPSKKGLKKKRN